MAKLKVLSVASEVFPLIKTGGLADVAGALPGALAGHGVNMRTLLPGYPAVMKLLEKTRKLASLTLLGQDVVLRGAKHAGLNLIVLDAPTLFDRPGGPYVGPDGKDWPDNWLRFAVLSKAALSIASGAVKGFVPDIVHAHDWQAGLVPAYLRFAGLSCPSVITVHNIAFQGQFSRDIFHQLEMPDAAMGIDGVEYYGDVGFLKAGLQSASAITTVSPTYATEILSSQFGMGLEGVIAARLSALRGIVNGIDTGAWNPSDDAALPASYDANNLSKRAKNRAAVEEAFGLTGEGPILTVVTRLTWQKGMDVLADALDEIVARGARLALLGSGDPDLEAAFRAGAERHPGRIGVFIGYSEPLSHLVQGGADAIVIPSRFEPCGLTQLYGLRYGCIPVVARTGGLADTVIDANTAAVAAGVATGIVMKDVSHQSLMQAVDRLCTLYPTPVWEQMQRNGMAADVSWDASAAAYADLYQSLV
jgi:starch synthase